MNDLFKKVAQNNKKNSHYTAKDIEVLEGLEAVRKRPGMYIGGTDQNGLMQLFKEIFDNAMDEVISGHATEIYVSLENDNHIIIRDNGRGIPVDNHPKFPDKSALEVILSTLHSGGKFSKIAYNYSGGLHGVGISVVNSLSSNFRVEVKRSGKEWSQNYSKGKAISELISRNLKSKTEQGTNIIFKPDPEIFGELIYKSKEIYELIKTKSYLYKGVKIYWSSNNEDLSHFPDIPKKDFFEYQNGIGEYILNYFEKEEKKFEEIFAGSSINENSLTKIEWAVIWSSDEQILQKTYCNTIETSLGGAHEVGFKTGLFKALKHYSEILQIKKAEIIIMEDLFFNCNYIISCFIKEPEFQGQTKDKLVNKDVSKEIELMIKDNFEIWLNQNRKISTLLVQIIIENAEYRLNKKNSKIIRKNITQKITLPGKLTDCSAQDRKNTELFIVEGDSAGGSAKQARDSKNQAILPLRGKVLNVANNSQDKILANKELADLELALGCGSMDKYIAKNLRYEKVIIMTDADIDGAHIASLLLTFFFLRMPELIKEGHLYLARPPLYKISQNNLSFYAQTEEYKEKLLKKLSNKKGKIEINRFKGLGEMNSLQLKETTMSPSTRSLIKVSPLLDQLETNDLVNKLMGKNPELRLKFIREQALLKIGCLKAVLDL